MAGRNGADAAAFRFAHDASGYDLVRRHERRLPTLQAGARLEGRFGEIEDGLPRITTSPHRFVRQDELTEGRIPARGVRVDGRVRQTVRHRVGIGKEGGLGEFRIPRPEADADLLGVATDSPDEAGIGGRLYGTTRERSEERRVGKECRSRWS